MSNKINNENQMTQLLEKNLNKKNSSKKIVQNMKLIGKKILKKTYEEVNL